MSIFMAVVTADIDGRTGQIVHFVFVVGVAVAVSVAVIVAGSALLTIHQLIS